MSRRREKRRIANGGLPPGAIPADRSRQARASSQCVRKDFYVEVEFTCVDCGCEEAWTAEQQKWFYEVAKGSLYATAVRCRACRERFNEERELQRQQMRAANQDCDPA